MINMDEQYAALHVKSPLPINSSSVLEELCREFRIEPVVSLDITGQAHISIADSVKDFLSRHHDKLRAFFLIYDLFLTQSEVDSLQHIYRGENHKLLFDPTAEEYRDKFCSYGHTTKEGDVVINFGRDCLTSYRIYELLQHSIFLIDKPLGNRELSKKTFTVFNAGQIEIPIKSLGMICAGLSNEGVDWLYTKSDDLNQQSFVSNYLRMLMEYR